MPFGISSGLGSSHIGMMTVQENVRTLLTGRDGAQSPNSLYSRTPILGSNEQQQQTPKPASRRFMRRYLPGHRPDTDHPDLPINRMPTETHYSPAMRPSEMHRDPATPENVVLPDRHPSDPAPHVETDHIDDEGTVRDSESVGRVRHSRRHKTRRHHHHRDHMWVRKHGCRRTSSKTCASLLQGHTRTKCISTIVSGLFLAMILAIYLTLALTIHDLGQELHLLFILIILGSLIFFTHSLIRLCVLAVKGPGHQRTRRTAIPSVAGPEGFAPEVPIRVHLARDEEIAAQTVDGTITEDKLASLKAPPPAYGLWRCSVRVNPALLHWQRVDGEATPEDRSAASTPAPLPSIHEDEPEVQPERQWEGPRPPSYMSDDGVEYVVAAAPRNTVYMPQPTDDIHPAYRECV